MNAVVLQPLPFAHTEQLVRITADLEGLGAKDIGMSPPELFDYRDSASLFDGIAGLYPINANLTEVDEPERVEVLLVSPDYFSILGAGPALGRVFSTREIGIRISLGARPRAVVRMVAVHALQLACVGTAAGAGCGARTGAAGGGPVQGDAVQRARGGSSYARRVATLLLGTALVATAVPARRASRVDPVVALRRSETKKWKMVDGRW